MQAKIQRQWQFLGKLSPQILCWQAKQLPNNVSKQKRDSWKVPKEMLYSAITTHALWKGKRGHLYWDSHWHCASGTFRTKQIPKETRTLAWTAKMKKCSAVMKSKRKVDTKTVQLMSKKCIVLSKRCFKQKWNEQLNS